MTTINTWATTPDWVNGYYNYRLHGLTPTWNNTKEVITSYYKVFNNLSIEPSFDFTRYFKKKLDGVEYYASPPNVSLGEIDVLKYKKS